jgi:predicted metal-dependent peptidase
MSTPGSSPPAPQAHYIDGVLLHEIHHILFNHAGLARRLDPAFPHLLQVAMDASANEYIAEPLPAEPIRWEQFAHLGLCAGQSTLERYDLLAEARRAGRLCDADHAMLDDHRLMHDLPGGLASMADPVDALVELLRGAAALTAAESGDRPIMVAGRDPASLLRDISAALPAPIAAIGWRKVLNVSQRRVSLADPRWPSRRFPDRLGQVPGRRRRSVSPPPRVLAAIDTSGSMQQEDLAAVAVQIGRLASVAAVTVVECDAIAIVQRVYRYDGQLEQVSGGGTDLRPVFDPDFLAAHAPDAVVYFTDGDGPHPDAAPAVPTIWVLTDMEPFGCPWGVHLRLYSTGRRIG